MIEAQINFLGIDFGTSNCMACAINSQGEIEYAKLEGENHLLPTVLFVPRVEFFAESVDEFELSNRLQKGKEEERSRYLQDLRELQAILETYDGRNKPKYPDRPVDKSKQTEITLSALEIEIARATYEIEMQEYQGKLELHQVALENFQARRKIYEQEQRIYLRAIASDETIRRSVLVAMQRESSEEADEKYWSQTFFSAMADGEYFVYGRQAINMYAEDPLGGFFMRSPKSFLATELKAEYKSAFIKIVENILRHIKNQSEKTLNRRFRGAVLGRPVNYHGTRGDAGNNDALEIMRKAAKNAGFESIKFFYEPVAAALSIANHPPNESLSLVIDVGGGTTDCALIEYEANRSDGSLFRVLKSGGTRIGGTDFDQAVAWSVLMPYFGKGSFLGNGLPLPTAIHYDAISTRDLQAQMRFRKSGRDIIELARQAESKLLVNRLIILHESQAQHRLLLEAERIKIFASSKSNLKANLNFIELDLRPEIDEAGFESSIGKIIERVLGEVRKIGEWNNLKPQVIYVTGGMSQSPVLIEALAKEFGHSVDVRVLDSLSAVGLGLGLVADHLSQGIGVKHYYELGLSE